MNIKRLLGASLAAAVLLVAPAAYAVQIWTAQPASGYLWNGEHSSPAITRSNGMVTASEAAVWVTPIQLSAYNVSYTGIQNTIVNGNASVQSRVISFDKEGNFYETAFGGAGTNIGTVFVPINGTIFVQSHFTAGCGSAGCGTATLRSVKLTY